MEAIDVVMLTKNSEHLLTECLQSIYENVPVKRLIVVDGFSTDGTLEIMDKFNRKYGSVKIITEKGSRAKAREKGIQEVETQWFMFADSDVILCKNWFRKAVKHINNSVGAIWGLNIDVIPNVKNKFFLKSLALVARECFNLRGGMHDTLLRLELVEDIEIPEQLHAYEDAYIVNWIKKKGYNVIIGDEIYCLHYRPSEDWNWKESLSLAALEIKCGLIYSHTFRYVFYYPFFAFYWLLQVLGKNFGRSPLSR
ncbi:MAG: glycosyltransferase family 2 protein [Candidatus Bathyarchaeota archaeon]|nr:glycosyltransferase family 2 protein [Candidatus Bathyarchaeota archaeon]MDH5787410.1 glycosyltransferase family 2 protein [Candidatus Bathyarchaeota archaeon]